MENRLLLKKMLQIDLKPSALNKKVLVDIDEFPKKIRKSRSKGQNSYSSLNRGARLKEMAQIVEDNKVMLKKLYEANSCYSNEQWEK